MATNPNIKVGVDTSDAVKSLENLEGAAVEAEGKVEAVDGDTVSLNASDAIRALEDVGKRLDDVDAKGTKAGGKGGGISTSTTAFKDLTEGIGGTGQAGTAVGSIFGFGEAIEGLGDILEGFGGKLGLSEEQVGKLTEKLGSGLAILGGLGVALTIGMAAMSAFGDSAKKAREKQKAFDEAVESSAENMRDLVQAMREGDQAKAIQAILEDITPLLDQMAKNGLSAKDAILEIMGQGTPFTDSLNAMAGGITGIDEDSLILIETMKGLATEIDTRREGMKRAKEQDEIARQVLEDLNLTTEDATQKEKDRLEAIKATAEEELRSIDAKRAYERSLDDVQQALIDYQQEIKDAKGDTEKIEDATRDAADSVIELAQEYGGLEGAAVGTEDWQKRTTTALGYVAATLAPDSPLRKQLLDYIKEIESIPTVKETNIKSFYSSPDSQMAAPRYPREGGINVTVNGALDPNAVARQIQRILSDQTTRYSL